MENKELSTLTSSKASKDSSELPNTLKKESGNSKDSSSKENLIGPAEMPDEEDPNPTPQQSNSCWTCCPLASRNFVLWVVGHILFLLVVGAWGALQTHSAVDTISILLTALLVLDSFLLFGCGVAHDYSVRNTGMELSIITSNLWRLSHPLLFLAVCQFSTFLMLLVTRSSGCNLICPQNWLSTLLSVYVSGMLFLLYFLKISSRHDLRSLSNPFRSSYVAAPTTHS